MIFDCSPQNHLDLLEGIYCCRHDLRPVSSALTSTHTEKIEETQTNPDNSRISNYASNCVRSAFPFRDCPSLGPRGASPAGVPAF